ncbi:TPA: tyrosine protein phosphatase [Candidatus Poribacteria bacterium]|nr:tyrosine protein phosphatase [Candidatus Poribacteria bacterium]
MLLSNLIDIHSHILPDVDDGAKEIEDSLRMIESAYRGGVRVMIATPHKLPGAYDVPVKELRKKLKEIKDLIEERGAGVQILLGRECYLSPDLLDYMEGNRREEISIEDTGYILVEFPLQGIPRYADDLLSRLQFNGLVPIIAHPERCVEVARNPNLLEEHIEKGRLFQINAGSLLGRYGRKTRETAEVLITHRFAHFVASDMHSPRSPTLGAVVEKLESLVGERECQRLLHDNPLAVLGNMPIVPPSPIRYKAKRGLSRIFPFFR